MHISKQTSCLLAVCKALFLPFNCPGVCRMFWGLQNVLEPYVLEKFPIHPIPTAGSRENISCSLSCPGGLSGTYAQHWTVRLVSTPPPGKGLSSCLSRAWPTKLWTRELSTTQLGIRTLHIHCSFFMQTPIWAGRKILFTQKATTVQMVGWAQGF